jgi:hypothetical protein
MSGVFENPPIALGLALRIGAYLGTAAIILPPPHPQVLLRALYEFQSAVIPKIDA